MLENEGPRGKFRRKLRAKLAAWNGSTTAGYIDVYEEPWGLFTLADRGTRARLAAFVAEHEVNVLAAGPVQTLGIEGGGTPAEVRAFAGLLAEVRELAGREVAALLVHHENQAGQVSGAWAGVPDSMLHLTGRGHGHAGRVGEGPLVERPPRHGLDAALARGRVVRDRRDARGHRRRRPRAGVLAAVDATPGWSLRAVEEACKELEPPLPRGRVRAMVDVLLARARSKPRRRGGPRGSFKLHLSGPSTARKSYPRRQSPDECAGGPAHARRTVRRLAPAGP